MKTLVIAALLAAVLGAGANDWRDPNRWKALGSAPAEIRFDETDSSLVFEVDFTGKEKRLIYPMFHLLPGERLAGAVSLRLECRAEAGNPAGSVVLPKQEGVPNYFPLSLRETGEWQVAEAKLHPRYDPAGARICQIQLIASSDRLKFRIRKLEWLDREGKVLPLRQPETGKKSLYGNSPLDFFFSPGQPARLTLTAEGFAAGTRLRYHLDDYRGKPAGVAGEAAVSDGKLTVELPAEQGFRELVFPEIGSRFGLIWQPPYTGAADDFWGVNSILGVKYLHSRHDRQHGFFTGPEGMEHYFRMLRRCGIRQVREMAAFFHRAPSETTYDFNRAFAGDLGAYALRHDLRILTFYEHFPGWLGTTRGIETPPEKVVRQVPLLEKLTGGAYPDMLRRESAAASGIQVLNENDVSSKNAPPDGTATMTWLTGALLRQEGLTTPVVGMAFAGTSGHAVSRHLFQRYAENGFLEANDAFAFNHYGSPGELSDALERVTGYLAAHSPGGFPDLWITECGKPWRRGSERAPLAQDLASADWIVRKAVEAKAFGVGRYYVFCLPYFDENSNNFGLFDYNNSPQRAFAAYAAAVMLLSGKQYAGDLAVPGAAEPVRVFTDGKKLTAAVAVKDESFPAGALPDWRWFAIDGSCLTPDAEGNLPAAGGLLYAELEECARFRPDTATAAMRAHRRMAARRALPRRVPPVILRHHAEAFRRGVADYYPDEPRFTVKLTAYNLSAEPREVVLVPEGGASQKRRIAPGGQEEFAWEFDMAGRRHMSIPFTEAGGQAPGIVLHFQRSTGEVPIPGAAKAANWRPDSGGAMTAEDLPGENAVRFTTRYREGADCWAFPQYDLRPGESAVGMTGVAYEIRAEGEEADFVNSGIFFAASEAPRKYSDLTPGGPKKGVWETRRVYFREAPEAIITLIPGVLNKPCRVSVFSIRNLRFF